MSARGREPPHRTGAITGVVHDGRAATWDYDGGTLRWRRLEARSDPPVSNGIEQSTHAEIEETVCERLAATDSYALAWMGEVDAATRTVTRRATAGADGYLDDVTVSVDPDDEWSTGPTGRALRTGEIRTV